MYIVFMNNNIIIIYYYQFSLVFKLYVIITRHGAEAVVLNHSMKPDKLAIQHVL